MTRILVLHGSPRPAELSVTRRLGTILVERLLTGHPEALVVERDLAVLFPEARRDGFENARRRIVELLPIPAL